MGRYSRVLSPVFADFAGVRTGQRVLDVGCERCRAILPPPPFTMTTAVWAARGSPKT
jgi:hypothetical protein